MKKTHVAIGMTALLGTAILISGCASTKEAAGTKPSAEGATGTGGAWANDAMKPVTELFKTEAAEVFENVKYASQSESQVCDIYIPSGKGSFPVIALVHGGGFAFQNQKMKVIEPVAQYAVAHGYAVVSIDYRKSSEAQFPGALSDVKAAIRFIRANADRYKLNANDITIWGESAGAYLAVMTALTPTVTELNGDVVAEATDNAGVSSAVKAAVDFYGPIEFYTMDSEFAALGKEGTKYSGENSFESKYLGQAVGANKAETYRTYWESYKNTIPSNIKVWIQAGTGDLSVPYTQSKNLAQRLSSIIGNEKVHFSTIEGAKHMDSVFYTDENLAQVFAFLSAK